MDARLPVKADVPTDVPEDGLNRQSIMDQTCHLT